MADAYRLIDFPASDTGNGTLAMFQKGGPKGIIPFDIKKVLVVSGMKSGDVRGNHAHRLTQEVVVAIRGGCDFTIDDGVTKHAVTLEGMKKGLFLPARVWRTFTNFQKDTILLLIADQEYDEKEYVRSYEEFKKLVS